MGSFEDLIKKGVTAGATALGGPIAGGIAGAGMTALSGGDLGETLAGGLSSGLSGLGDATGGTVGQRFVSNLGFTPKSVVSNTSNAAKLMKPISVLDSLKSISNPTALLNTNQSPWGIPVPIAKDQPMSLLETLQGRAQNANYA